MILHVAKCCTPREDCGYARLDARAICSQGTLYHVPNSHKAELSRANLQAAKVADEDMRPCLSGFACALRPHCPFRLKNEAASIPHPTIDER